MFYLCMFIFSTLLFFILTPDVFISIPSKSNKKYVTMVHALIFAISFYFINNFFYHDEEKFADLPTSFTTKGNLMVIPTTASSYVFPSSQLLPNKVWPTDRKSYDDAVKTLQTLIDSSVTEYKKQTELYN